MRTKSAFTFISISLLMTANSYSMNLEEEKTQVKPIHQVDSVKLDDLLSLELKEFYITNNLQRPDDRADFESIFRDFMQAKNKLRSTPESIEAAETFKRLARFGHTHSALELGHLCVIKDKVALALRWYTLAFDLSWIRTGQHDTAATKALKALKEHKSAKTEKKIFIFLDDLDAFLGLHTPDVIESLSHLLKNFSEEYLKPQERNIKVEFIKEVLAINKEHLAQGFQCIRNKNYEEAAIILGKIKSASAYEHLGFLHLQGNVGRRDSQINNEEAARLFLLAQTPLSLSNLGIMYAKGYVGRKGNGELDYEKAAEYYAASGSPESLFDRGSLFDQGLVGMKDGKVDYQEASKCYSASKTPLAWFNLGIYHMEGHLTGQSNDAEAANCFLISKTPTAYENLGILYGTGRIGCKPGEPPNYTEAANCYRKAGTPKAYEYLGMLYDTGRIGCKPGETPNYTEAANCYRKAGTPHALNNLGLLYMDGLIGCDKDGLPDFKEADLCFIRADIPYAWINRAKLLAKGYIGRIASGPDYDKAEELYRKAYAATQNPMAMSNIGHLYHFGHIGRDKTSRQPNFEEAKKCYKLSGNSDAKVKLAALYIMGHVGRQPNGKPNYQKAWKLWAFSDCIVANFNILLFSEALSDEFLKFLTPVEMETARIRAIDLIKDKLKTIPIKERAFYQGIIAYQNKEYESAYLYFSDALIQGEPNADLYLKKTRSQIGLQKLLMNNSDIKGEVQSKSEIDEVPFHAEEKTQPQAMTITSPLQGEESTSSSDEVIEAKAKAPKPSRYNQDKKELTREEKYKRNIAKINQRLLESSRPTEDEVFRGA